VLGCVGGGRGTTGGRRLISDGKDRASGIRGLEGRDIRRYNGKLKAGGVGGIPPLGLEVSRIRTCGEVDVLPGVDVGGGTSGGIEIYVGVLCSETRCVPGDVDRCGVRNRLGRGR
jgi:hypothetical protein